MKKELVLLIFLLGWLFACSSSAAESKTPLAVTETSAAAVPTQTATPNPPAAADMIREMGRGINIGNALESPNEGDAGVVIQEEYFDRIQAAGFKTVRIPIRWSAHAGVEPPYTIAPAFFQRVDEVIGWAQARDLIVIINVHNYIELMSDPAGQRERYAAIWEQIAAHYQGYPPTLVFELLNEPNGRLDASLWNEISSATLGIVRASHPNRIVIIGPVYWNNYKWLSTLDLPEDDPYIIATFHYYQPYSFTHQGAGWVADSSQWLGTNWYGTEIEEKEINDAFDLAAKWGKSHQRPILLGEFGAYYKADLPSRIRWTEFVARAAEARGFAWTYWEFCSGFGIYDTASQEFLDPLLRALIP